MSARPLIRESLLMLNLLGLDPHKSSALCILRAVLMVTVGLVFCVETLLNCVLNWQGLNSVDGITMFVAFLQMEIKAYTVVFYRKRLTDIIRKMEKFWYANKYGTKLQNEIESVYTLVKKTGKLVLGILVFGSSVYVGAPCFSPNRSLMFQSYHPLDLNRSPDYEIIFALQILSFALTIPFLLGFDGLFVSLIINIICELKIIKAGFKNIPINPNIKSDTRECLAELYKIIHHHNLTLECIRDVREVYSNLLLTVFFNNMLCMCSGLLAIIATGFPPSLGSFTKYGIYLGFFTMQLYFYCMVGTYLITESESVAASAYDTAWWAKSQPKLRKALVLVIQRANKMEKLTAGGMFALNLASFRKVARTALSFFTLVEAVYKNN